MILSKKYKILLVFSFLFFLIRSNGYTQTAKFPKIQHDSLSYLVNGHPFYLYSGEFDYFRVPKKDWQTRMRLFKQAGGNCLAIYIPWILHEPEEGKFVFKGTGQYDIEGFLQMAKEEGLYVIARPGPYIYSEMRNGGLPDWLFKRYPALRAMSTSGEAADAASYLHPLFLKKVKQWFDAVCPLIAKYQIDKGGPVAFVQLDNECGGFQLWHQGMDYNAETMGFGKVDGRFPKFLGERYLNIDSLNAVYHTSYAAFKDVKPFPVKQVTNLYEQRQAKDYADFYFFTIAEYFRALAGFVRGNGVKLPFVANSWNTNANMNFYEASHLFDHREFILGADHYYNLSQNWPANSPDPQYAIRVFQSLESLRLLGVPPTVFEFPGGSVADWPPITATDVEACLMMHLGFGMKGLNYYVFTAGPNPGHLGSTTDNYDFNAAIAANGKVRPLYNTVRKIGGFLKENQWLSRASKLYDCRVGFDYRVQRADQYWSRKGEFKVTDPEIFTFLQKGMLNTLLCNSYSPVLTDLYSDNLLSDTSTPLIVVSSSVMPTAVQQRIVRFLQKGGKVLLCPVIPEYNEKFEPCHILKNFLGGPELVENMGTPHRICFKTVSNVFQNESSFATTKLPVAAHITGVDSLNNKPVSWLITTPGKGQLHFLGFKWYYEKNEQGRMLTEMMQSLGAQQLVTCSNKNLFTSLRSDGHKTMLFIMNLFSSDMETNIEIKSRHYRAEHIKLTPMSVKTVLIP